MTLRHASRLSAKNAKLLRPTLFNYITTREEFEHYTSELFQFMTRDKMDVRIHEVYPLEDVARAHQVSMIGLVVVGSFVTDRLTHYPSGSRREEDDWETVTKAVDMCVSQNDICTQGREHSIGDCDRLYARFRIDLTCQSGLSLSKPAEQPVPCSGATTRSIYLSRTPTPVRAQRYVVHTITTN